MTDSEFSAPKNEFSPRLFCKAQVIQYLQVIGLSLIAASIVYLIAANWLMIPKYLQLAIPMTLLLCSALSSIYFTAHSWIRQSLDCISGLMLGMSMAVIGQVYQTGADSYLLFLIWAVLLLPWLYRPNIGVFALFCAVSQLALSLFFKQSFLFEQKELLYLFGMNVLTALSAAFCLKFYPALRFVFIAFIAAISAYCMFNFCSGQAPYQWPYLVLSIILPLCLCGYFYKQRLSLETSLQAAGLAASVSILIFHFAEHLLDDSIAGLLVLALLVFAWFAVISLLLIKMLPNTQFAVIPLAIGAWFAGIILASLLLTYWKTFSILMGLAFIVLAWWMIRRVSSVFARQFAYCLWLCGQVAVLVHTQMLTDSFALILLMQLGFTLLCMLSRMHWLIVLIQLVACYGLSIAALGRGDLFRADEHLFFSIMILNGLLLISLLCTGIWWLKSMYRKAFSLWMLFIVWAAAMLQTLLSNFMHLDFSFSPAVQNTIVYGLPLLWLCLYIGLSDPHDAGLEKWLAGALGFTLILMGYFEIFLLLVFLSWAVAYQQRLVQGLTIVLLILMLWLLYYNLDLSFLLKSLSILVSGALLLAMAQLLMKSSDAKLQGAAP